MKQCSIVKLHFKKMLNLYGEGKGVAFTGRRTTGDLNVRVHIYMSTALGRSMVASPMLDHHYTQGKPSILIL